MRQSEDTLTTELKIYKTVFAVIIVFAVAASYLILG